MDSTFVEVLLFRTWNAFNRFLAKFEASVTNFIWALITEATSSAFFNHSNEYQEKSFKWSFKQNLMHICFEWKLHNGQDHSMASNCQMNNIIAELPFEQTQEGSC